MDPITIGALGVLLAFVLIGLRVPIAFSLAFAAGAGIFCYFAFRGAGDPRMAMAVRPTMTLVYSSIFGLFHSYAFSAIPMFVALGHVAFRSGITSEIYHACRVWLVRVPGGLAVASLIGCGGFSAISGSSIACAATMGRVCVPEMTQYGYSDKLATGSVAAGGTLGSLIPPSILFILYGIFAEQSVSALFLAGALPGLLTLGGYISVVIGWSLIDPSIAPRVDASIPLREKLAALVRVWPAATIFLIIFGGIYMGIFTATEAAAVSLLFTVLISVLRRSINLAGLGAALKETTIQTGAIFLVAGAAKIFVSFISLTGLSGAMVELISAETVGPVPLFAGIVAIYVVMGMFLDPVGIMLLTLPFVLPLVEDGGYNLIWFGVIVVKLLEMGLITPPVGLNVFVVHSVTERSITVGRIFAGVARFFVMDVVVLALLLTFPVISLLVPSMLN